MYIIYKMLLRKKICKRLLFIIIIGAISFYISVLLFGDITAPIVMRLTDLNRCPACYGVSVCPELYSNQISLDTGKHWTRLFNAKNIYYGVTKTHKRVVLKKLAQDWELKVFDSQICKAFNLKRHCNITNILYDATNIEEKILKIVQYNLTRQETVPRKGLVFCPYAYSIFDLIKPLSINDVHKKKSHLMNLWTMLTINPEPLILQVLPKSHGWAVPAWGGLCGRLEVIGYEGEPLSSLRHIAWHRKLLQAQKILGAALDFTFKHERFRFYLMDWSLDNIVANENDDISFVDLEDVIVLDKFISPGEDLPNWYKRYSREITGPGFTFSIENMCRHHLSDHNLWAACYVLAGDDGPLLYPIPHEVNSSRPHFDRLLYQCLHRDDRFGTVTKLQEVIRDILNDEKIIRHDPIR